MQSMLEGPSFCDRLAVTLCLSLCLNSMAVAATGMEVKTVRTGEVVQIKAQATIQAPMAVVWATLTDYDHLHHFVPGIKQSRVLSRKADVVTVVQAGQARFLMFTVPIDVTMLSIEKPPSSIEVQRVSGTLKQLQGRYETEDLADKPGWVQLRWQGLIEPENPLPPLIGEPLMRHLITNQFNGLVREIERRQALAQAGQNTAPTTVVRPSTAASLQADEASPNTSTPIVAPAPVPSSTLVKP